MKIIMLIALTAFVTLSLLFGAAYAEKGEGCQCAPCKCEACKC